MKKQTFFAALFSLSALLTFLLLPAQTQNISAAAPEAVSQSFMAIIGLDAFSAYRMNLSGEFEGTRHGLPSSGSFDGFYDVTKQPHAQHLQVNTEGEAFNSIAPLGSVEAFKVKNSYYVQNPQDGSWQTIPGLLVDMMLPGGIPAPEESIDLPVTAIRQPGTEVINGIVTQRYTFGADDLPNGAMSRYDNVEGEVWVAVSGNYVVKYEATISGQFADVTAEAKAKSGPFDNLLSGDLTLIDEGTLTVRYELSDINGNLSIELPDGVGGFGFGWF